MSRFPQVLISGYDSDPDTADTLRLEAAHDVIYQRPVDVRRNIWWINAQRPLAERIVTEHGIASSRWRDYLFQRYADIIISYAVQERWSEEVDPNPDVVNQWIVETLGVIHDSAARDLDVFLFGREVADVDAAVIEDGEDSGESVIADTPG